MQAKPPSLPWLNGKPPCWALFPICGQNSLHLFLAAVLTVLQAHKSVDLQNLLLCLIKCMKLLGPLTVMSASLLLLNLVFSVARK